MPRRRWTREPTGFITALATRSDDTAVSGSTSKKSTSTGVINAPPPIPVRPTTMPIPKAAAVRGGSKVTTSNPNVAASTLVADRHGPV